jgi:hypothetical protein
MCMATSCALGSSSQMRVAISADAEHNPTFNDRQERTTGRVSWERSMEWEGGTCADAVKGWVGFATQGKLT